MERPLRILQPAEQEPAAHLLTVLFADIRGYTRFTQQNGDEAGARLTQKFARIGRATVEDHGGEVLTQRGDDLIAVFPSAREALYAAIEMQQRFQRETEAEPELPLRVGIALDAGEALSVGDDFRGGALNLASRLCAVA